MINESLWYHSWMQGRYKGELVHSLNRAVSRHVCRCEFSHFPSLEKHLCTGALGLGRGMFLNRLQVLAAYWLIAPLLSDLPCYDYSRLSGIKNIHAGNRLYGTFCLCLSVGLAATWSGCWYVLPALHCLITSINITCCTDQSLPKVNKSSFSVERSVPL